MKICPRCSKPYEGHPALSRKDNKTEICSQCGTIEALAAFSNKTCIFEKRYCKYANKRGDAFKCEAPSDEEMTCGY